MKRISADLMLTPTGELVPGHQLTFDDRGTIHYFGPIKEQIDKHLSGTVSPGFINTHCHLELSHLENRIPQKNGLHGFISDFLQARKNDPSPDPDAIKMQITICGKMASWLLPIFVILPIRLL
jgi:cytosine/adenosine deaminase-related metal-dependent hydrolase